MFLLRKLFKSKKKNRKPEKRLSDEDTLCDNPLPSEKQLETKRYSTGDISIDLFPAWKDKRGINCVYEPNEPSNAVVDIVFLHGLTGSADKTWYHVKSKLHWPSQLLKEDIPAARILMFGYDANVVSLRGATSQNRTTNHAENMLKDLVDERAKTASEDRPLLFVVHSLGGLVLKRALQLSSQPKEARFGQVEKYTRGIAFLGTPHSGSDLAAIANAASKILKVMGPWVNPNILATLEIDSETSSEWQDWFATWLRQERSRSVGVTCFYEEYELPMIGKIVPDESAKIPGYPFFGIAADHTNMPKISCRQDLGYQKILGELLNWIKKLSEEQKTEELKVSKSELATLDLMPIAIEAAFNSKALERESFCLKNTRESLLKEIYTWATGDSRHRIFWLCGMAGTGKSTIARTTASEFSRMEKLGASFFFSKRGNDVRNANKFSATIAKQLALKFPTVRGLICEAIEKEQGIFAQSSQEQWDKIIKGPLSKYKGPPVSLLVVLDALDECDSDADMRMIIHFLTEAAELETVQLRIFLTSRPETPIRLGFKKMKAEIHQDFYLHEMPQHLVDHDIYLYFQDQFSSVRHESECIGEDWPGEKTINDLVKRADGLFIYAATVCGFIRAHLENWSPQALLEVFLPKKTEIEQSEAYDIPSKSPTFELDSIYLNVLELSIKKEEEEDKPKLTQVFRVIIGSVVVLSEPLSLSSLGRLLNVPRNTVFQKVRTLQSVMRLPRDDDETVRLLHTSFRDFLLDNNRCRAKDFWIDEKQRHRELATRCIRLMESSLKRDICEVRAPGTLAQEIAQSQIDKMIPSDVQYACVYWFHHLREGGDKIPDEGEVHMFLRKHILHWLEVLAILQKTSNAMSIVTEFEELVALQKREFQEEADFHNTELYAVAVDTRHFVSFGISGFREAPLQVYCSALMFAPTSSLIKQNHKDQIPLWFESLPPTKQHWSALRLRIQCHSKGIRIMTCSPNGCVIVTASWDFTIKAWEKATGKLLRTIENRNFLDVGFLDNNTIVVFSLEDEIEFWDIVTGKLLKVIRGILYNCGKGEVMSSTGIAAVGSMDTTEIWDLRTATSLKTLDGTFEALTTNDKVVTHRIFKKSLLIWDLNTWELEHEIDIRKWYQISFAFSPQGDTFFGKRRIGTNAPSQLRELPTGKLLHNIGEIDGKAVFSSDGSLIVAYRWPSVDIWDVATMTVRKTITGLDNPANCFAFSSDNMQLILASAYDVQIWDWAAVNEQETFDENEDYQRHSGAVVFAPDGSKVVADSTYQSVKIIDLVSNETLRSQKQTSQPCELAFSPDSKTIAMSLETFCILDATSGELSQAHDASEHFPYGNAKSLAAFSPDGSLVFFSVGNYTILLDTSIQHFETLHIFEKTQVTDTECLDDRYICGAAFSFDGSMLAIGDGRSDISIWDLDGLRGKDASIQVPKVIIMSQINQDYIIPRTNYNCEDDSFYVEARPPYLYDNPNITRSYSGHSGKPRQMGFLHDDLKILIGFSDNTAQLREVATGVLLQSFDAHEALIRSILLGPKAKRVLLGSRPDSTQVWDAATDTIMEIEPYTNFPPTFSIDASNQWITVNNVKILYIPPDFRQGSSPSAIAGRSIAINTPASRLSFFRFRPDINDFNI